MHSRGSKRVKVKMDVSTFCFACLPTTQQVSQVLCVNYEIKRFSFLELKSSENY